ncbi:hypothetical protein SODALDRAFT_329446 [Sodiomyces alkalinus F11]|uniref:Ubiquitin-protein ligase n=1 Tax=Sodiomyces alkalinus (strain CBS 110278 / VKM F-3762 / F11) TaxID=1314773 RepID=A0A3N2PJX3_SODAK|nr:hypothetical protein SODALDRAFT_329446 [Sodiomyces alkalinus F11]ROT34832.1 hypothetical protein SODALDRAFT_329446 [Sodiomyces alkalinus F11]
MSATDDMATSDRESPVAASTFSMDGAKGLGSVFSYATSKWALCCVAMAILLNRTYIFAATRRRVTISWPIRTALRLVPIVLLLIQARRLLQSIQCQTSPEFAEMRWGNTTKNFDVMFIETDSLLHTLSTGLLFGSTDQDSCVAMRMVPNHNSEDQIELRGSLSILWPLFGTFCLSQFLETLLCAVQGRPAAAETGMTLFEHSLAFAEADAAISSQLSWTSLSQAVAKHPPADLANTVALSRSMILNKVNTPPEVLLVAFFSVMSHLTSHALGVFNLQARFRLLSTGFWGLCFMSSIAWSAYNFTLDDPTTQSLLRYPTVCIIGFVPHILVLGGILTCFVIYLVALLLLASGLATGCPHRLNFRRCVAEARANMQANVSLSDVRIRMEMDFYTALLRTGFAAITMASEAVYLNEDRDVNLKRSTWLEDQRFRELNDLSMQWARASARDPRLDSDGTIGLIPMTGGLVQGQNGYRRERAAQELPKFGTRDRKLRDGVGAAERSGRWLMALDFVINTHRLMLRVWVIGVLTLFSKLGIRAPGWLLRIPPGPRTTNNRMSRPTEDRDAALNIALESSQSGIIIPKDDTVDVEAEFRRRSRTGTSASSPLDESDLDAKLYGWWLRGGWWGLTDTSGEYRPSNATEQDDDDAMSIVSSITGDENGELWESDVDEGSRTPTQSSLYAPRTLGSSFDNPLEPADLARLLDPSNPEEKEEARALAAHLSSPGIITRSRYRSLQHRRRLEIFRPALSHSGKLSPEEEGELLEKLLLSRRGEGLRRLGHRPSLWSEGADGLGQDGPQCVVCQSMPRTIILWPCRCLSLCDDCRVSLAMNNFDKCVCCRREVVSFSRIFVP